MKKAAIIGMGLMGGSLGVALRRLSSPVEVAAYARRADTRELALSMGAADTVHDSVADAVKDADIVVFCTPILTIPSLLEEAVSFLKPGAVITDVGSTKSELQSHCQAFLHDKDSVFVGSHPVAGSEQSGLSASREDLYQGAVVVITPSEGTEESVITAVSMFWASVGARVLSLDPHEHDRLLAATSHVPHVIAAVLASYVHSLSDEGVAPLCGTGFKDTTRVASGSPEVWQDILQTNGASIASGLRGCRDRLDEWIRVVESGNPDELMTLLEKGRQARNDLLSNHDDS